MLVAYMRCCTDQVIRSILPPIIYSKEHASTFLGKLICHSIAYQYLRCHTKLVEVACCDVGFTPRDLDRSLMSRQSLLQSGPECDLSSLFRAFCKFVLACTHILAIRVDVHGSN